MTSIESIAALGSKPLSDAVPAMQPPAADFMASVKAGAMQVDSDLVNADQQLRAVAAGQDIPVHDLMISMEQARLSLTLLAEVRNRVIEGYQELTRMQL